MPFSGKRPWRSAQLAVHGKASSEYDPVELKAYLVELTSVLGGAVGVLVGVKGLLFWQVHPCPPPPRPPYWLVGPCTPSPAPIVAGRRLPAASPLSLQAD